MPPKQPSHKLVPQLAPLQIFCLEPLTSLEGLNARPLSQPLPKPCMHGLEFSSNSVLSSSSHSPHPHLSFAFFLSHSDT